MVGRPALCSSTIFGLVRARAQEELRLDVFGQGMSELGAGTAAIGRSGMGKTMGKN
jgi:hypothetical protein